MSERPSPHARNALAMHRRAASLSSERKDAIWTAIEASVAADDDSVAVPSSRRTTAIRVLVASVAMAAGLLLYVQRDHALFDASGPDEQAIYDAQVERSGAATQPRKPSKVNRTRPTPPSLDPPPESDESSEPLEQATSDEPAEPTAQPQPVAKPRPEATRDESVVEDALRQEILILERARAAVRSTRGEVALRALDEHAKRFAEGQLAEDREALRPEALCLAGRQTQAHRAAQAFLRAYEHSVHEANVRTVLLDAGRGRCQRATDEEHVSGRRRP